MNADEGQPPVLDPATEEGAPDDLTNRARSKRDAIMNAASVIFNARGMRGGTLADVSASVGLATNSVAYYFKKKEDIAAACVLRSLDVAHALVTAAQAEDSVEGRVRLLFARQLQLLADIERGTHPTLMHFSDLRAMRPPHAKLVFERYEALARAIRNLLKGSETSHYSRPQLVGMGHYVTTLFQWSRLCAEQHAPDGYAWVAEHLASLVLGGLAARGSQWPDPPAQGALVPVESGLPPGTEDFLRAATQLINEEGYKGASIDKIAARLNLTKGAFYSRHETKSDLVTLCFDRTFAVIRSALQSAASPADRGYGRVCAVAQLLAAFQLSEHGPLLRNSSTVALPSREQQQAVRLTRGQLTRRFANLLVDGMDDGSIRPHDAPMGATVLVALIDSVAGLRRWEPSTSRETVSHQYLQPALEGILRVKQRR